MKVNSDDKSKFLQSNVYKYKKITPFVTDKTSTTT